MEVNWLKKIKTIISSCSQQSEWEDKIFSLGVKVFVWMISIIITSGFLNTVCFVSGFLVCGFSLFFQIFDFSGETNIESDHQENIQIDPPQTVRIPSSCTIYTVYIDGNKVPETFDASRLLEVLLLEIRYCWYFQMH